MCVVQLCPVCLLQGAKVPTELEEERLVDKLSFAEENCCAASPTSEEFASGACVEYVERINEDNRLKLKV